MCVCLKQACGTTSLVDTKLNILLVAGVAFDNLEQEQELGP